MVDDVPVTRLCQDALCASAQGFTQLDRAAFETSILNVCSILGSPLGIFLLEEGLAFFRGHLRQVDIL